MSNYQQTSSILAKPREFSKSTKLILSVVGLSLFVAFLFSVSSDMMLSSNSALSASATAVLVMVASVLPLARFWRRSFWVAVAISGYIIVFWLRNLGGFESEVITPATYLIAAGAVGIGQLLHAASSKEKNRIPANYGLFILISGMVYLTWLTAGMPGHGLFKIQLFTAIVVPICLVMVWRLHNEFWVQILYYLVFFGTVMMSAGIFYLLNDQSFVRFSLNNTIDVLSLARIYSYAAIAAIGLAIIDYKQSENSTLKFWALLGLAAVFVFGIMLTGTRAATILVPIVLVGMLFFSRKQYEQGMASTLVRIVLLSATTLLLAQRFLPQITIERLSTVTFDDVSVRGGRTNLYRSAVDVWQRSPLYGNGVAGFDRFTGLNYPHNSFLEFATDFGVIGVLIYTAFIVVTCVYIVRMWRGPYPPELVIVYTAFFVNAFVRALFSSSIYGTSTVWLFALLLGRLYLDYQVEADEAELAV